MNLAAIERPPEDVAMAGIASDSLRAALVELPAEQRRAVVLAAIYGRTAVEIAEGEGVPLGTARAGSASGWPSSAPR